MTHSSTNSFVDNIYQCVARAGKRLAAAGVSGNLARFDAEVLARDILGWDRATYLTRRDELVTHDFTRAFDAHVARRERREPVAQILGRQEFWGLDFEVSRDVLTPRPETEIIIEQALTMFPKNPGPCQIIDVGTGSGCLAIALAHEFRSTTVIATDISAEALAVARRNAHRHGVEGRIEFRLTSVLAGIEAAPELIVGNLPYVPPSAAPALAPEVRDHEPAVAIFGGGREGMDLIVRLLAEAGDLLAPAGWLMFEFGYGQDAAVKELTGLTPELTLVRVCDDLQGVPRTAILRKRA